MVIFHSNAFNLPGLGLERRLRLDGLQDLALVGRLPHDRLVVIEIIERENYEDPCFDALEHHPYRIQIANHDLIVIKMFYAIFTFCHLASS